MATAEKTAVELLAATETDAGMVKTLAMPPERETEAPEGAGAESVTVQEVLEIETRVEAAHCSEEINTEALSDILNDAEEPLREAVTVAV